MGSVQIKRGIEMLKNVKRGTKVKLGKYEGTVERHYDGSMYEVRLERGMVCIDLKGTGIRIF